MTRGGKRQHAGRKKNSGVYKEPTKALRVPTSLIPLIENQLKQHIANIEVSHRQDISFPNMYAIKASFPFYSCSVQAGFPSQAEDHIDKKLDLNDHLVKHPAATFFVRVSGDSMIQAGIHDGDLLIVDRAISARHGSIVIAALNGEMTVKRLYSKEGKTELHPENPAYPIIEVTPFMDFCLWGVVTNVIHSVVN